MKKLFSLFLPLAMSLASCGVSAPSESKSTSADPESSSSETSAPSESKSSADSGSSSGETSASSESKSTSESSEPSICQHEFVEVDVAPSLEEKGYTVQRCNKCGEEQEKHYNTGLFEDDSKLNILFIGNSYTFYTDYNYDKPNREIEKTTFMKFKQVANAANIDVRVDSVTTGGYSLLQHADSSNPDGAKVEEKLSNKGFYDLVFMQEQSMNPSIKRELFYDGVRAVYEKVQKSGAKGILYETWGRNSNSPDLARYEMSNESHTQKNIAAYQAIADELHLPVCHVGTAFYDVYTNYSNIINLYDADNYHPSDYGTYLIAYVFYATVFGRSPVGLNVFGVPYEDILQQAAYDATFGKSILKDEYKTSSIGVTANPSEEEKTISERPDVPASFIQTEVVKGLGDFEISKDENGIYTFKNASAKSSLMFKEELFSGSGRISFDLTVDGRFNGASNQGIVFGNSSDSIHWSEPSESFYCVGRTKDGNVGLLDIYNGSLENQTAQGSLGSNPMGDSSQTYRISLLVDREAWKVKTYVNETYAGALCLSDHYDGAYIGLMSGINGNMAISNIQINDVGIQAKNCINTYLVTRGQFDVSKDSDGHPIFASQGATDNETFVLKNFELTDGTEVEFDFKSSNYEGSTGQGILFGCSSDADEPYNVGAVALIGRLKNGKIGGITIDNTEENVKNQTLNWKFGTEEAHGDALQVMGDDSKTYHLKAIYHFVDSKTMSVELYVDGTLGRHLKYVSTNNDFGKYIGFNSGLNGQIEISKIQINGNYYQEII